MIDGIASGLRIDYSGIWGQSDMDGEPILMFRAYIRHLDESVLANGNPLPREYFGNAHRGAAAWESSGATS